MNTHDIQLCKLTFAFTPDTQPLFQDFSLHAKAGELHCVVGPNGAGKSTLMRIINGQVSSSEQIHMQISLRHITADVRSAHDIPSALYDCVALVEQKFDRMLAPSFTARENLQLANMPRYPTLSALPEFCDVANLLVKVALPLDRVVGRMSGGQRQILAILMMLQRSPWVLLLDEPSAALDVRNTQLVFEFLRDLARSIHIPVIVISHDQAVVERHADAVTNL